MESERIWSRRSPKTSCAAGDESVTTAFDQRVLPVDATVARRAAALRVSDPAPFRDALIGATALVNRMAVVTRNVKDFERFDDLDVVNPWGG